MYFSVLEEELKGISYGKIFHTHRMLNRRDLQFCYYFIFNISLKFYFFLNFQLHLKILLITRNRRKKDRNKAVIRVLYNKVNPS